jgi:SAM-dependent methyltransferase
MGTAKDHGNRILDQFTKQAIPFATSQGIRSEDTLRMIVEFASASAVDHSLDVACGPGLLACAFAKVVRYAAGIDITPAMLQRAKLEAGSLNLQNLSWCLGDVSNLPYADGSFTIVSSRYAFHHILDPLGVLREMRRVCTPGGRIVLIDSSPAQEKAEAFNCMEKLRDPSHVRAMPMAELCGLFKQAGLPAPQTTSYRLRGDIDGLLSRSFPSPGDDTKLRHLFETSVETDPLDMELTRAEDKLLYGHPTAVLVSVKD